MRFSLVLILLVLFNVVDSKQLRRKLRNEPEVDISQLRYLTLGASATWGATLPDRTTGYPYQLSPNVTNLAVRASGPNFPSICIESMVGDENIYDVIILEYLMPCFEGLDKLAIRIRQRFPDAIIILNMMWIPTLLTGKGINGEDTSFNEIWRKHGFLRPITPEHISTITSEMASLELNPNLISQIIAYHEKVKNAVNAHLFGIEELRSGEWNNKDWVASKLPLFHDIVHFSQSGHDYVANGIKSLLQTLQPKPSNNLGTFGEGDSCHMWYNSGEVDIDYNPKEQIKLNEFSHTKFALEIPFEGGDLIINNPFPTERHLMITYMTTGPSFTKYPKAEIIVNDAHDKAFLIDPLTTGYRFNVHVSETTSLFMIPPGDNKVSIKPIEQNNERIIFPFRVVALSVVGDADPNSNFAPGPPAEQY